jgi:methionyl-tRNA formyltransferase
MKLQASAVKQRAVAAGIPVAQPQGLKLDGKYATDAAAAREALLAADADVMVVAAYGLILPQWVLDLLGNRSPSPAGTPAIPRGDQAALGSGPAGGLRGCLNIHASLLPRWRGAAPIHRAIEAGDAETGVTVMQMDAGLDTGAMGLVGREAIRPDDTTASLHDRLAALGGRLIVEALRTPDLAYAPQPADGITYAHKIDKAESAIDWRQPAAVIERRLRAFDPFPGGTAVLGGETLKVWRAERAAGEGEPGAVLAPDLTVACGDGALRLLEVQRPGGKRGPAAAFLQARPVNIGERFDQVPALPADR